MKFAIILITTVLFASAALASEPLSKVPKGYQDGRVDAKYGTYTSVVEDSARGFQSRVQNLEQRAMGLSALASGDKVKFSENVFVMEYAALRLHLDIADAPSSVLNDFERESLLFQTTRIFEKTRLYGEVLFEDMVRFIDIKIPGPNGLQVIAGSSDGQPTYHPNYRTDKDLTDSERSALYQQKLKEFESSGGSLAEIKVFSPTVLTSMKAYTRVEYVEIEDGSVRLTEGKAGHILLAEGLKVRSAGQLILLKNNHGKPTLLIVSNASGSYKPDISSALQLASRLGAQMKLGLGHVVVTKGEPLSTQAVKIYAKGLGGDYAATLKPRLARLQAMEQLLNKSRVFVPRTCRDLFR